MSLVPFLHLEVELAGAEVGDVLPLDAAAGHHLTKVLRLRPGADVEVSDGRGRVSHARLGDGTLTLTSSPATSPTPRPTLTVAQGLPRSRKFDEVARQVTELGVDRVVPVTAARSVTRLDGERATKAVDRWTAITRAAAEQSRRSWRPAVTAIVDADGLVDTLPGGTRLFVAHVGADLALPDALATELADHLAVAVGPEGGWADDEVTRFVDAGATVVGLGPTVLRTEHAAAAALAVLAALGGRWG